MTPEREEKIKQVLAKRQNDLAVVMENVHDPHNIMAVTRTCDAVGIQNVFVIDSVNKFEPGVAGAKSSASANKWVDMHVFKSVERCFVELRKQDFKILCTHLHAASTPLHHIDMTEKLALVFGNEKEGTSNEALMLADGNFMIPQVGMIQSLNISVACAVTIYEAYRQREEVLHYQQRKLSTDEYNGIFERWKNNR